ncbi:hypothetical protein HanIR_Chr17g0848811 [Helianthus annuus]|nr:hypothetical protein HanIR_Chr17g0848811 [Helianthus annuus]
MKFPANAIVPYMPAVLLNPEIMGDIRIIRHPATSLSIAPPGRHHPHRTS